MACRRAGYLIQQAGLSSVRFGAGDNVSVELLILISAPLVAVAKPSTGRVNGRNAN